MIAVRRLISILGLSLATAAVAQQAPAPAPAAGTMAQAQRVTEPVTADTDKDVSDPRSLRLSLGDAIQTSIRQNLGVELQRYSSLESGQDLLAQYGIFDPLASAALSRSSSDTISRTSATTSLNFGLDQNLPAGGRYSVGATNARGTTQTSSLYSPQQALFTPSYSTGLSFGMTQPLARNFGVDIARRGITLARNTLGVTREQFRGVLLDTTNAVEQAYYDLVYARQYVDVVKDALFLARDQARITQIRIDVGASAPLDILQPRVQIATTEEQLIAAMANVRSAEDRLRQLLNLPPAEWDRPIVPTDNVAYTPMAVDFERAVAQAYELRPEIRENQLLTANSRVQYLYTRNQMLPQVDAVLAYNVAGAAGRTVNAQTGQPVAGVPQTTYSDSLQQLYKGTYPGWNAGVNVGVPIFNHSARAAAKRAELEYKRSLTSDSQTRQSIAVEVRSAARAIDTAAKEITATRAARDAAEKNLDAERKRFENGMTTNFQVLQVQQQLSDARARELQALVSYNKAVTAYHRAVGDLLEVRSITVDEPPSLSEPRIFARWDRFSWLSYGNHLRGEGLLK